MRKTWLTRYMFIGLLLIPFVVIGTALAQNDVTFQVRMNIKMRETTFQPGNGDRVRVAGDFNSWNTAADTLLDGDGDSTYTIVKSLPAGAINYKFIKTLRGGLDWEGDPNRTYTVVAGAQIIPNTYFDRDSIYTPPVQSAVTFHVNMRVKLLEGAFQPGLGDRVRVAGSFNDWGNSPDTLFDVAPTDSIYQKTVNLNEGSAIQYKFLKTLRGGSDWENGDNKTLTVPPGGITLSAPFFDNDSLVSVPTSGNIVWRVDMRALQAIGWFNSAANDTLEARGSLTGWDDTSPRMTFNAVTGLYQATLPYSGSTFDDVFHKYFIKMDSVSAAGRFPGYGGNKDGVQYDHAYERGDGNRIMNLGTGGNISAPPFYFSSIHRFATMNNVTDTCRVTVRVNMGPATRTADPFVYATDTVSLEWEDFMWQFAQVGNQGTFPGSIRLTRQGATDSVWAATFKVKGKAHGGMMYRYRYTHAGGGGLAEGGGLGGQKPYRVRFIQQTGNNLFPATYTIPLDAFQLSPPMPVENPPFGLTDVGMQEMGVPEAYALNQNYPNPFNPATRITYSIPENAKVSLKVFNLLGQEVATLVSQDQTKGNYVALFEANKMATGVYFYRLEAGKFTETKKMLLLK